MQAPKHSVVSPSALFTVGILLALFTLISGPVTFWDGKIFPYLASFRHGAIAGLVMIGGAILLSRSQRTPIRFDPAFWALSVFLFLFTDWLTRGYSFFQGPIIRGELLIGAAGAWAIIRSGRTHYFAFLLPITIVLCIATLLVQTEGRAIISDDLATFLYRLELLKQRFPHIPFYNPQWNGGLDQRDFFATGALNVLFVAAPLVYFFDLLKSFDYIIAELLFIVTPLATFLAARFLGQRGAVPYIAATVSMTSGLLWYRWAMAYGTLGFIVSSALFPLVLALTSTLIERDTEISRGKAVFFCIVFTLMLFWSASGLAFLPAALCGLIFARTYFSKRRAIPIVVVLLVVNISWLIPFFVVSKVGSFVTAKKQEHMVSRDTTSVTGDPSTESPATPAQIKGKPLPIGFATSAKLLREAAISTSPFILALCLPGYLLLTGRRRILFGATAVWLLILGSIGAPLIPQLELDRMLVIFGVLSAVPCAVAFQWLLDSRSRPVAYYTAVPLGAFLIVGPFCAGAFLENRSIIQYHTSGKLTDDLSTAIKEHGGPGRVIFSGFILHELEGGHIAPLALRTGKPLMASSHVHNVWRYKQIIPKSYLDLKDAGIEQYLDLYNVTGVVAHERFWREYFRARPERYEEVFKEERFLLFKRNAPSSYFIDGKGSIVSQDAHRVVLDLETPEATIKFNYFPFLTAGDCSITPAPQLEEIKLIRISCKAPGRVTIESRGIISRVLG